MLMPGVWLSRFRRTQFLLTTFLIWIASKEWLEKISSTTTSRRRLMWESFWLFLSKVQYFIIIHLSVPVKVHAGVMNIWLTNTICNHTSLRLRTLGWHLLTHTLWITISVVLFVEQKTQVCVFDSSLSLLNTKASLTKRVRGVYLHEWGNYRHF